MSGQAKIGSWAACISVMLLLAVSPLLAQHDRGRGQSAPPPRQERRESPRPPRNESRPQYRNEAPRQERNVPRNESRPEFRNQAPRPERNVPSNEAPQPRRDYMNYAPPSQGHHSGQWLERHRQQPIDQQQRALQRDPSFQRLPRETQQEYERRLQRFNSMPPERQQQVLRRMETWEHLTPQQKRDFQGFRSQFNSLPQDRKRAVHNAIDALRAMPPDARQREVQSGRFSQFSPQERQLLNDASRLPLAPSQPQASDQQPTQGQGRYVPRPPQR